MPNNFDRLFNQSQGNDLINALVDIKNAMLANYTLEDVNVTLSNVPQTIVPNNGYYGLNSVNVPAESNMPILGSKTIMANGTYDPHNDLLDGYNSVTVAVPSGGGNPITITTAYVGNDNIIKYFNTPITLKSTMNCYRLFQGCYNFNQPMSIPDGVTDCSNMFDECKEFNQAVSFIPSMLVNCPYMFNNCRKLNATITLGNNIQNCANMFYWCNEFNQPITIPGNSVNCAGMFSYAKKFNQPVTIPDTTTNCGSMFLHCEGFNKPITIGNNVTRCSTMFSYCLLFNQPISFPNTVTNMLNAFSFCNEYNQPITIPESVVDCKFALQSCQKFGSDVYILNTSMDSSSVMGLFWNCNNDLRKNVWCNNIAVINGSERLKSLVNADITWTEMTNGYYNSVYNIYLYSNYPS